MPHNQSNKTNSLKLTLTTLTTTLICSGLSFNAAAIPAKTDIKGFTNYLDKNVPKMLEDFYVPGSAVAVIKDGQVVYQKGFGYANVEKSTPVNTSTGFNIGSISKTVAAWGVMKLVEQGKVSLDAPVEKYLKRWKLPKSKFDSKGVTVRRLLSHTAGLSLHGYPGWGPEDKLPSIEQSLNGVNNGPGDVKLIMEPGTKWKYSGGGYTICQLLIEEVSGQNFSDFMREQVLKPLGMKNSDYQISPRIVKSSAIAYDSWATETPNPLFTAKAAAGLHTTIADFSQFALANLNLSKSQPAGRGVLKPQTVTQMFEAVPASKENWGLGYGRNTLKDGKVTVGHGGANRGWHAVFNVIPQTNDGILVTTNGSNGYLVHQTINCQWEQWVTGIAAENNCVNLKPIYLKIGKAAQSKGIDAAISLYHKLKKTQPDSYNFAEYQLNILGYELINSNQLDDAIKIFKLNVKAYPKSGNPYDSLAEAYMNKGENKKAIENYKLSLKFDPKNSNATTMIEKLRAM